MKKMGKKMIGLFLVGMFVCGSSVSTDAEGLDAAALQRKFPSGTYWNHVVQQGHDLSDYSHDEGPCNNPDGYTWFPCATREYDAPQQVGWHACNSFMSVQCYGFAAKLTYDVYGSTYYDWVEEYGKPMEEVKPGDVIFYYGAGADNQYGHRAMILDVDGTEVRVGECNWGGRCLINWGRWVDTEDTDIYFIIV